MPSAIQRHLHGLYHSLLADLAAGHSPDVRQHKDWDQAQVMVISAKARGKLSREDAQTAAAISHNVLNILEFVGKMEQEAEADLKDLADSLTRIAISGGPSLFDPAKRMLTTDRLKSQKRRQWPPSPSPSERSFSPTPTSTPLSSAPSSPTASAFPMPIPREPSDHIREWFLDHLASPFPTFDEKIELSRLTGIARPKIDSDLTNWRRRTGWTDVRNKYGDGDKEKTKEVIERVLNGEDDREDLVEAVEKMKSYLKREREFAAGDWIKKVSDAVSISELRLLLYLWVGRGVIEIGVGIVIWTELTTS